MEILSADCGGEIERAAAVERVGGGKMLITQLSVEKPLLTLTYLHKEGKGNIIFGGRSPLKCAMRCFY